MTNNDFDHVWAGEYKETKKLSLSKEDMALEALIKLVVNIKSQGADNHFTLHALDYAIDALRVNGWEVVELGHGRFKAVKISDAKKA